MLYSVEKFLCVVLSFISSYQTLNSQVVIKEESVVREEVVVHDDDSIMELSIPKIGVSNKIYSKDSNKNNIDKNVMLIGESDTPDKINGNVILGGHSGIGKVAYFNDLVSLDYNDSIFLEYNEKIYEYKVVNKYLDSKNGSIVISRNLNSSSITLFTCMPKDKNNYLVIIGKLV